MFVEKIQIIPAKFVRVEKNKAILRCHFGTFKNEDRKFDVSLFENIDLNNADLLFVGILLKNGRCFINIEEAGEYKHLFGNW